jgi:multidrug resistance efflux pump
MKNTRFGILVIGALLIGSLALALLGPKLFSNGSSAPADKPEASAIRHITAKAIVESEYELEIGSQIAGIISHVAVAEGDAVTSGATLATLDSGKIKAKVDQAAALVSEAHARLRKMETGARTEDVAMARNRAQRAEALFMRANDEYQRQERLYENDAVTLMERDRAVERKRVAEEDLHEAQAGLRKLVRGERTEDIDQARADLARVAAEHSYYLAILSDYRITSPINGVVTDLVRKRGETVDVGTPVMKLIDPQRLRVKAEVEETDLNKVRNGQQVELLAEAYPGKVYRGKVYQLFPDVKRKAQKTFDPMASFDVNTQQVFIRLDSYAGLKNGMTVTVRFIQ